MLVRDKDGNYESIGMNSVGYHVRHSLLTVSRLQGNSSFCSV